MIVMMRMLAWLLAAGALAHGQAPTPAQPFAGGSLLHAHNAYPEKGRWQDRLDRALATGLSPIVIEQDVAFDARGSGRSVVSHDDELTGTEPGLQEYFFDRVRPLMARALAEGRRERWPLVVLHLDFKTNEPAHHRAIWDLLQRHEGWLTTADRGADAAQVMPLRPGPLMVLTENGAGQEAAFSDAVTPGRRLLIFGSVPAAALTRIEDPAERARQLATAAPAVLMSSPATNYRRWANFAWQVVEEGGPPRAGAWTAGDQRRLAALVNHAHGLGLWIRFYTLNGHRPEAHPEWTASYNFGTLEAAHARWRAAVTTGVDLIATDQYEELAAIIGLRK